MKKLLAMSLVLMIGITVYAQNHLSVNGVTLGQDFYSVTESLKRSYPNSAKWGKSQAYFVVTHAYLGNIQTSYGRFYPVNGRLAKCEFGDFEVEDINSNYYSMVASKYNQLVRQFSTKYGQPYVSESKNGSGGITQVCSWQIGSDRITIMFDHTARIYDVGGSAEVKVTYLYGQGTYHGF